MEPGPYKGHIWIKDISLQWTRFLSHFNTLLLYDLSTKDPSDKLLVPMVPNIEGFHCIIISTDWQYGIVPHNIASSVQPADCNDYDIKIVGGTSPANGKLMMCLNGLWGVVCGKSLSTNVLGIVCRQLNYQFEG